MVTLQANGPWRYAEHGRPISGHFLQVRPPRHSGRRVRRLLSPVSSGLRIERAVSAAEDLGTKNAEVARLTLTFGRQMNRSLLLLVALFGSCSAAAAAPCMSVTLTGTKGGPAAVQGLAGAGTLVQFGDETNNCSNVKLQFDAGRGTSLRLSELGITAGELNAIFFTHMHSDHTDGFADLMQLRWHYQSAVPKIDMVCSADAATVFGAEISCAKFAVNIGAAFIASGEIAQRHFERKETPAGGPAELISLKTFSPTNEPAEVWSVGEVKVLAIQSAHMAGHASYRVNTPAGSVVIGGDASNDTQLPPRSTSTSEQVERLSQGADIIVHSTTHPNMGPERGGGMPAMVYFRQSNAIDLGAMAQRAGAKYFMATHLTPALGEVDRVDRWKIVGAPLKDADFRTAIQEGGFTGTVVIGHDLTSIRLPAR